MSLVRSFGLAIAVAFAATQAIADSVNIFVGNLPKVATSDELEDNFDNYGVVERVHLPVERDTGAHRGYAYITMSSASEAEAAVAGMNGVEWAGNILNVEIVQ